jgi:dTDP-4-amino-4,6-dideoxygalactose transaminase
LTVPLLDLRAQHASIQPELDEAIARVFAHGGFVGGPEVAEFEEDFADYCEARHCVGVSSGTDALALALRAAGVGQGDEVITTPLTFIATIEAIVQAGASPVLVDPDPATALLRAENVEAAITGRTAALVPVHLYGQPVDMEAFRTLADERGLLLVEDAAQAHGAAWSGRKAGSQGDLAAFSFFPGKNLGAPGDAGAVVTDDPALASRVRSSRDHGRLGEKYRHAELGTNAKLDTLHAAVLGVKLKHLDRWNEARRLHAAAYDAAFEEVDGVDPVHVEPAATSAYHQYVVRVAERDRALASLQRHGVAAGIHYPIPVHRQPALAGLVDGSYPNAERLAVEVLSLPVYPELPEGARDLIVGALREHAATAYEALPNSPS